MGHLMKGFTVAPGPVRESITTRHDSGGLR
jgi:hypothetical protein